MNHVSNYPKETKKKHFCLPIFNRATYGRCRSLIDRFAKHPDMEITVPISSAALWKEFGEASSYIQKNHEKVELVEIEQQEPTHLGMVLSASEIQSKLATYFAGHRFDGVIAVADRYEILPTAMAASYQNIPLIHIQGGEVTGNIDDKVRHSVTKLSDYHFVSTRLAKEYLIAMGEEFSRVFYTGCPSLDVIHTNSIHRFMPKEKYILCIFHPETENPTEAFDQTKVVLQSVLEYCLKYAQRCYWYFPNPDPGREEIIKLLDRAMGESTVFIKAINQEPEKFLRQLAGARLIIGNSSCGIRESSYIGVPSINVGARQGLRERAENVMDASYNHDNIFSALEFQHKRERYLKSPLYGSGRAAEFICNYLAKIDLTTKPTLTYPTTAEFRETHFGENRFHEQRKRIGQTNKIRSRTQSRSIQSKLGRPHSKNAVPGESTSGASRETNCD